MSIVVPFVFLGVAFVLAFCAGVQVIGGAILAVANGKGREVTSHKIYGYGPLLFLIAAIVTGFMV